ncbi:glycosyltransferase family 4 protein [Acaryochloris sp. IP29b_bin.148]|uniref:glycosyltransferase family 4 protein n=1 Tax=Acaryochloris sp. IP29b_bin.148 TaxID=2969218 RepID=UPI00260D674E|nr:glycosyltransferase family 4 protein [Acaryochloris sp. IP29b_bin.148]
MKVLLSAYSCEPNKGSEPGVGWRWAIELADLGHQVWVITRANNQQTIEQALSAKARSNLQFVYYDLPAWMRTLKKGPGGIYFYYICWQWGIYQVAKSLSQQIEFDWVHHITFGVLRQPSFLAFLDLPFILGPLGGGERAPYALRQSFQLKGHILDSLRDLFNLLVKIDPVSHAVYRRSTVILCKTQQTLTSIPQRYEDKCRVYLEIGIDSPATTLSKEQQSETWTPDAPFQVLYVGRLVYWKGLHLGLQAFAQFHQQRPESTLTVIGSGPDASWFHQLATQLEIDSAIHWIPWMDQRELMQRYAAHNVFLFPSLHDSSGNVILESLAQGLPVICLDLGGPGVLVDQSCGRVVKTADLDEHAVVQALADRLKVLSEDVALLAQLQEGAYKRAREYQWSQLVRRLYVPIEQGTFLRTSANQQHSRNAI